MTLRVTPPAHPETMPRRVALIREVGQHTEQSKLWTGLWPQFTVQRTRTCNKTRRRSLKTIENLKDFQRYDFGWCSRLDLVLKHTMAGAKVMMQRRHGNYGRGCADQHGVIQNLRDLQRYDFGLRSCPRLLYKNNEIVTLELFC